MSSAETPSTESENTVASTALKTELVINRPKPRAFGVGRFGKNRFDERDNTRYSWVRAVPAVTALFLALVARPALAANVYCEAADAETSLYGLCKPDVDAEGANAWGDKINTNFDLIETAIADINASTSAPFLAALDASTTALAASKFAIAGGTVTGNLTVLGVSSAPVLNVSTIAAPGTLNVYTNGGFRAMSLNSTGVRFNQGTFTKSQQYEVEVVNTGSPGIGFRRDDETVNAGNTLGFIAVYDSDVNTGGSTEKAYLTFEANEGWQSNQPMEQVMRVALSTFGGTPTDFMVLSSTGLLVGRTGSDAMIACSTCALQVISPAGYGASFTGKVQVDGFFQPRLVTETELATLTPGASGQMVINITNASLCISSGTTVGAWVLPKSTSTTANVVACY